LGINLTASIIIRILKNTVPINNLSNLTMRYPDFVWINTPQSELSRNFLDKHPISEYPRNFLDNTPRLGVIQKALKDLHWFK